MEHFFEKSTNKSKFKLSVNILRDRGHPNLSLDTPRLKFDLILGESKSQIRSWLKAIISFGTLFWKKLLIKVCPNWLLKLWDIEVCTPDLRPKFDLILCPGWVNPSHKFETDNLSINYDQICDLDSPILAIIWFEIWFFGHEMKGLECLYLS